jgi:hypothetical protein
MWINARHGRGTAWARHAMCESAFRLRLKCDGTRAGARFRLSAKRTSPFKSAGRGGEGGGQFSRLLAGELCASSCRVCTARASLCSAVMWRLLVTHSIPLFPLHFSTRVSPCAITFQTQSTFEMSARLSTLNNSVPTGWVFMKTDILVFFENLSRKFKFSLKSDKNNWYFTWRPIYSDTSANEWPC